MLRILSMVALCVAVAFGGSIVSGSMSGAEAKKHRGAKICRHVTLTGKVKKWRCKRGRYCCHAEILGYYGCGNKYTGCFQM
ncbi:MAG: hypothetical protein MI919_02850 [Holophagales bacterium]|nr:hypothetical protein [Holophagales bacterium]